MLSDLKYEEFDFEFEKKQNWLELCHQEFDAFTCSKLSFVSTEDLLISEFQYADHNYNQEQFNDNCDQSANTIEKDTDKERYGLQYASTKSFELSDYPVSEDSFRHNSGSIEESTPGRPHNNQSVLNQQTFNSQTRSECKQKCSKTIKNPNNKSLHILEVLNSIISNLETPNQMDQSNQNYNPALNKLRNPLKLSKNSKVIFKSSSQSKFKKIVKAVHCGHSNDQYYANGMCRNCYHREGRNKRATDCPHLDRKLYAKGQCKNCYLSIYHKEKRKKSGGRKYKKSNKTIFRQPQQSILTQQ
ncbi:UNKNOWN [Stylonychia lemnae]|uniref:Uncharacterized protein n=1 Tax=Stylonychia lemnae TaxID=5949 RepID=A0A078AMD8_STYLE|nr:UNKNOWN [Stylonychia lemnae]|eukprot:CDW83071.1 UNKNOWN [Stylonychia lemnae]